MTILSKKIKNLISIAVFTFTLHMAFQGTAQRSINVMTFNIRFDNPKDAPNDWPNRKDKVTSQILFHQADIIGLQEALHNQVMEMEKELPGYKLDRKSVV